MENSRTRRCGVSAGAKNFVINSLLVLLSILFSFVLAEGGLRVFKREYRWINFLEEELSGWGFSYEASYHPQLGWLPQEGLYHFPTSRGDVTTTVLSDGTRSNGRENSGPFVNPGTVLAVGDSFTFGHGVSDHETWPALLQERLSKKVINAGVFGYGIDQIFLRTLQLFPSVRPDTIIISIIADDILRCGFYQKSGASKPYFILKDNELIMQNVPAPAPIPLKTKSFKKKAWFGRSLLVHVIMKRAFPDFWLWEKKAPLLIHNQGVQVSCFLLKKLEALKQAARVKDIYLLIQYTERPDKNELLLIGDLLSCLRRVSSGLKIIDLRDIFLEIQDGEGGGLRPLFDGHMTAEGNQLVADTLTRFMLPPQRLITEDKKR